MTKRRADKLTATQCADLLMRVSAYLDGDLEECCCKELEEYLSSHPECAQRCETMRELIGLCRSDADKTPGPSLSPEFKARLRQILELDVPENS
jgi:anti-sigma factor RsiW